LSNRLSSRWSLVTKSRANLVLVVVGCVLILMSQIWRFAVAPALKEVAGDYDQLAFYEGKLEYFALAPTWPVQNLPLGFSVVLQTRIFNRTEITTSSVSAVEEDQRLYDRLTNLDIWNVRNVFTINRETCQNVFATGANRQRSGYYILFPFNTPKSTVPYWIDLVNTTVDAQYEKSVKKEGLTLYQFKVEYHNLPALATSEWPQEVSGATLKVMFAQPDLPVADSTVLKPVYTASGKQTMLVEPLMGTIAEMRDVEYSMSMTVEDPATGFKTTHAIMTLSYTPNASTTASGIAFAKDELSKQKLQFTYIPLGFLALGLACLLVGLLIGMKTIRRESSGSGQEPETAESTVGPEEPAEGG